ncbi:hypothetical protein [Homoserinibacter sp. YIM 151385]|uniref:hypothetical protein n=1 Tax=Homoserinibacter sp. YIM 151385 TaxID=2985506 RepID=UPI0022EFF89B|nr:hypothetical protein [Homoserinibacter sp. YIM 151385]WBU39138.1 hypothetical protein OF852_06070 [Homoserinibacter sp. YIM 151385]
MSEPPSPESEPGAPEPASAPTAGMLPLSGLFLAIAGLVFGPRTFGVAAVAGLVIGVVSLLRARRSGAPTLVPIATIVIAAVALALTIWTLPQLIG